MSDPDSHEAGPPYTDECIDCEHRVAAGHHPIGCSERGGEMQNVGVSCEQ